MTTPTIPQQRLTIIPVPFDAKRTNCYIVGSNIVIETIVEYLNRVTIDIRDTHLVSMRIPKVGHEGEEGMYPLANFDSVLANFDEKVYAFVGGLADGDFTEILSGINSGDETTATIKTKLGVATDIADGYLSSTDHATFAGKQNALGFTPENINNKVSAFQVIPDNTHYPTEKLVKDSLDGKVADSISDGVTTVAPSQNAVFDALLAKQKALTCVGVKTSNYTANPFELVPCDISSGSFKVTLPTAPVDGTIIFVKLNVIGTGTYLTIATGGSDHFNTPTGTVEIYMYLFGEFAQMQYCSSTGVWTTFISAATYNWANNNPGVDATTPITNADISINTSTRVLTIVPPLGYFNIFSNGMGVITRFRKVGTINFPAFTDTSGTWYFYFNASGNPIATQSPWTSDDFQSLIPIYRIVWNKTLFSFTVTAANATVGATYTNNGNTYTVLSTITGGTTLKMSCTTGNPLASGTLTKASGVGDATIAFSAFSEADKLVAQYVEYHQNTISADDHKWKHLYGAIWENGFTMINNALVSGAPNADGRNSVIALTTGHNIDDNLDYTITNSIAGTPWTQDLGNTTAALLNATNGAQFRTFMQDAGGLLSFLPATRFPFPWNSTTNIPQYITSTGVRTPVGNTNFFTVFIYATQNPVSGDALKIVTATSDFSSITNARAFNWIDIQNTYSILGLDGEIRPLYRLIFEYKTSHDVGAKYSVLRETQDIRKAQVTSTTAVTGSLPASSVTVVPTGGISSTNVQSALVELDTKKLAIDSEELDFTLITSFLTI